MTLMDGQCKANIVHYGSTKLKFITRSVLAAELFALVHWFDVSSTIRLAVNDLFDIIIPLHIYTDSSSLFDSLTKLVKTTEKRLLIDLRIIRQCYERREISELFWIPREQNPADAFTKGKGTQALKKLMETNKLIITPEAWVERESKTPAWIPT